MYHANIDTFSSTFPHRKTTENEHITISRLMRKRDVTEGVTQPRAKEHGLVIVHVL